MEETMAHKEYGVTEILDILRRAQAGDSIRRIAKASGMDRKTISNYLRSAAEHGFAAGVTDDHLTEIALAVFRTVHGPQLKPSPSSSASAPLIPHRDLISGWLEKDGLTLTKSHIKLGRMGVAVSYSALYRYARDEFGFGGPKVTVRMAETELITGIAVQSDFGRRGMIFDPESGKQ